MPRAVRGLQSMPLAADGILYYSGPYNQVYALDGSTGEVIWYYRQKLDEDLVAKQTHSPYNRGIALGLRQRLHGHPGRQAGCHRHKDRQAQLGNQADQLREAHGGFHRGAAVREGQGHHRRAGRRMAVPRPDLRRGRQYGPGGVEVLHSGRQRWHQVRRAQHLGQRLLEDRRWRRLDGGHLRPRNQPGLVGHGQSGARSTTGRARTG